MNASTTTQDRHVAYILVKCEMGLEREVATSLSKIDEVAEVDIVYGTPYDVIVKVVCDTLRRLETAIWQIRRIARIISTQTMLVGTFA